MVCMGWMDEDVSMGVVRPSNNVDIKSSNIIYSYSFYIIHFNLMML